MRPFCAIAIVVLVGCATSSERYESVAIARTEYRSVGQPVEFEPSFATEREVGLQTSLDEVELDRAPEAVASCPGTSGERVVDKDDLVDHDDYDAPLSDPAPTFSQNGSNDSRTRDSPRFGGPVRRPSVDPSPIHLGTSRGVR